MNLPNINDSTNAETDCDTKIFDLHIVHITVAHNAETVAHTDHGNRIAEIATADYVIDAISENSQVMDDIVESTMLPEEFLMSEHTHNNESRCELLVLDHGILEWWLVVVEQLVVCQLLPVCCGGGGAGGKF